MDKNLYDLPPQELVDVPTVCGSLREALVALQNDRAFLTRGDVFSDDQIDAYIDLKWEEVDALGDDAEPGRIRHVLFQLKCGKLRSFGTPMGGNPPPSLPPIGIVHAKQRPAYLR